MTKLLTLAASLLLTTSVFAADAAPAASSADATAPTQSSSDAPADKDAKKSN